ncbi:MAG: VOC family protein [Bacteroidetes bacterium]|jgi:catechol 2,3-dioxygenase-like lactoylglutathione lyase family enzyme|nr:VOC family protein [Bacteroidota bacterium]
MEYIISGIQQIGIGVTDADQAWSWYRQQFGTDVPVFSERAEAGLMLPYTGGQPRNRYAIMAVNMQGGGGFEIWQYTCREPQASDFEVRLGDFGIFACKLKTPDARKAHQQFQQSGLRCLTPVHQVENGPANFFLEDPYGNIFQLVEAEDWFQDRKQLTGGVYGAVIGVSDIERALPLYRDLLGYDEIVYDKTATFRELSQMPGGQLPLRRVLLRHQQERKGALAPLLGHTEIELVQLQSQNGRMPRRIFENRLWGDLGFIHLCFDVQGMDKLKNRCAELGFPFTVDSENSFDMDEAAGRFSYIEDPDGTLIEFVEIHKMPIVKKLGWFLNLKQRPAGKALPRWMIKSMGLARVK